MLALVALLPELPFNVIIIEEYCFIIKILFNNNILFINLL